MLKSYITVCTILILFGICITPVSAQEWSWYLNYDFLNHSGVNTYGWNSTFLYDVDSDGDLDMIIGQGNGTLQLYYNDGFPEVEHWRLDNSYFAGLSFQYGVVPSMGDFDGDDSLELVLGFRDWDGPEDSLRVFRSRGTQQEPQWVELAGFFNISTVEYAYHDFIDWDTDGDYDLCLINIYEGFRFYRNTGSAGNPYWEFEPLMTSLLPFPEALVAFEGFDIADLNDDGFYDFAISYESYEMVSIIEMFLNEGTNENPVYPLAGEWITEWSLDKPNLPAIGDIDLDGDLDIVNGNITPLLFYYPNEGNLQSPEFDSEDYIAIGPFFLNHGEDLALLDRDNDSDFDAAAVYSFWWFPIGFHGMSWGSCDNTGSAEYPEFEGARWLPWHYYEYTDMGLASGDINGDGWCDIAYSVFGDLLVLRNVPNSRFAIDSSFFSEIEIAAKHPELVDLDSDGDLDLFVIDTVSNHLAAFENVGTPQQPQWNERQDWADGLDLSAKFIRSANLNSDDLPDLILKVDEHLKGYLNVGGQNDPEFQYVPGIFEDWQDFEIQYFDVADLDGDADDDIILNKGGVILFLENQIALGINDGLALPKDFVTLSTYPNPFNSSTTISFIVPDAGQVNLAIYDISGRLVRILFDCVSEPGGHSVIWDGRNGDGQSVSSGIYLYRLATDDYNKTKRMLLLK